MMRKGVGREGKGDYTHCSWMVKGRDGEGVGKEGMGEYPTGKDDSLGW